MRKIVDIKKSLVGSWVTCGEWDDRYYCVGEGENYVYLWFNVGDYKIERSIHTYYKDGFIRVRPPKLGKHGYENYYGFEYIYTFTSLNFEFMGESVKWVR